MAIVAHSIVVSRPTTPLTITSAPYRLVQWNRPSLEYRRLEVTGRYQAGSRLVLAVPDTAVIGGVIRVEAATWADVDAATATLYDALAQLEYTVTVTLAGVAEVFANCQPATIRPVATRSLSGEIADGFADFEIEIRCTPNV